MYLLRERRQPFDKEPPLFDQRGPILNYLFAPRLQAAVRIRSILQVFQQPVPLLQRLLISGEVEYILGADLGDFYIQVATAQRRFAAHYAQVQCPEEDGVQLSQHLEDAALLDPVYP